MKRWAQSKGVKNQHTWKRGVLYMYKYCHCPTCTPSYPEIYFLPKSNLAMDSSRSGSPIIPMAKPHDHQSLLQALRGQTVHIPDLEASVSHWPRAVSPYLDNIRHETKAIIDKYTTSSHFIGAIERDGLTENEQAFHG
jgi:hypothetical protein